MNNLAAMITAVSANPAAAIIIAIAILLIAIAILVVVIGVVRAIHSENPTPTQNIAELIRAFRGTDNRP